ncbi:uncharacterized protein [Argopecten irradians]|uniref:uncharacterized protein n=1 Tax=Argopecten irradians TaxID=31199 RepID=UPI00371E867C
MESYLASERIQLITNLKDVVGRTCDGRRPMNVVFIGSPACGKSSFINSFSASIADDYWREYAFSGGQGVGRGVANQITVRLKRFKPTEYVTSKRLQGYALPTLIDISGLHEGEGGLTEEILRLLFYGQLKENTNIMSVYKYGKERGLQKMRAKYWRWFTNNSDKVDRVIVVASATEPIPQGLINSVMKAARPTGDKYTREIPVFGMLTKFDQVDESSDEFKNRKATLFTALSLVGVSHRIGQCVNYCDTIDPDLTRTKQTLPDVDIPILRFMNVVCGSQYEVINPEESYRSIYFHEAAWDLLTGMVTPVMCLVLCFFISCAIAMLLVK